MALDLKRFFQACNPSNTLVIGKAEDKQYYIDFSSVRGTKIIEQFKRTIARLSPEVPTCQLFTGHIGCGKSTELLRLKAELEQEDFHVVYFESSQILDMADVDVTDILLAIAAEVTKSLEAIKINPKPGYFQDLFKDLYHILQVPVTPESIEFSVGIAKITSKIQDSPSLRSQLRQYLEPRTLGIIESINKDIIKPAQEKLKDQGKKGLVVIIDNLDRIDNTKKPNEQYQPEYLFIERGEQLKNLHCHVVYTVPLILMYSNALGRLNNRFGQSPKVLPMVAVKQRDNSDFTQGITLLKQMVMSRAFPGVNWEQNQNLITKVFDSVDTLERLCKVSGGHLRNLLTLLYGCLQDEDPPITRDCLETVIKQQCNDLNRAIDNQEWQLLKEIHQSKRRIQGDQEYEDLIKNIWVFEYVDSEGSWFDINPILQEAKEFKL
ncbi:P-loop NTPase fold protein [Anabaena azotica]|uniref:P-loop NTPase fold protein n=1 Tax=Anabaena azotica TaxID=197653 RepID=UPI0039A421AB